MSFAPSSRRTSDTPGRASLTSLLVVLAAIACATDSEAAHRRGRAWRRRCPLCCATCRPTTAATAPAVAAFQDTPIPPSLVAQQGRTIVSASGRRYLAVDSGLFDEDEEHDQADPAVALARRDRDTFQGTARKKAKTSIADAEEETFATLDDLLDSLPDDGDMLEREPPIPRGPQSGRVSEEERNASVDAFLYAASGEEDNDFHLIIGNNRSGSARHYMNIEISGLPTSGPFRARLKDARDQYKQFFVDELPGGSYIFYSPPIPVRVSGSLFFDIDHGHGGVGPVSRRPETAWEIHPITDIVFEPEDE